MQVSSRGGTGDPESRIEAARRAAPEAAGLLNVLAFVAPAPLPVSLVDRLQDVPPDLTALEDPGRREDILSRLARTGAVSRTGRGPRMPAPVQAAVRESLVRPVADSALRSGVRLLEGAASGAGAREDGPAAEDADREVWRALREHGLVLTRHLSEAGRHPDRALRLAARAGASLAASGDAGAAADFLERLEEAAPAPAGLEEPFFLAALSDQRSSLAAGLGRREEARRLAEQGVRRARRACEPTDPRLPVLLHNAGGVLRRLGMPEAARERYEDSRQHLEDYHSGANPLRLQLALDLSEVLLALGAHDAARAEAATALDTARERVGRYHPDTAAAVSRLGRALQGLGRREEARTAFEQAVEILERVRGPDHPALGTDLSKLGAVLEELGELEEARSRHRRALAIFEDAFGEDHRLSRGARAHLEQLGASS